MSDSTLREIWFELKKDGPSGFEIIDRVLLPDSADVASFRDKVKEKCRDDLDGIAAYKLKVFEIVDGNRELLDPTDTLLGHGTKGSMLEVQLPDISPSLKCKSRSI